jgi:hypothetical protein
VAACCALTLTLLARGATAQAIPPVTRCDSAAAFVRGLSLPPTSSSEWNNWAALAGCGQLGASAAAATLDQASVRAEGDSARVREFFIFFRGMHSGTLLAAFERAAQDPSATERVRLLSLDAMVALVRPQFTFYTADLAHLQRDCPLDYQYSRTPSRPNDLSGDVLERVTRTVGVIAGDAQSPPTLRAFASCWQRSLARDVPINAALIRLTYVCENTFQVQNGNSLNVDLTYAVVGTDETGVIGAIPGNRNDFTTDAKGTVRLSYAGQVIQTVRNGGKACP